MKGIRNKEQYEVLLIPVKVVNPGIACAIVDIATPSAMMPRTIRVAVGANVGTYVGADDGANVGVNVGTNVGVKVGKNVGANDGPREIFNQ